MSTEPAFYRPNSLNGANGAGRPATEKAFLVGVILPTQPAFVVIGDDKSDWRMAAGYRSVERATSD